MPLQAMRLPRKSGRTVREIVLTWRRLTRDDGAARTMIACSGGGDSSGLVLALAAGVSRAAERLVVAHIVHDLRPAAEAHADGDAAAELAAGLGLPFVTAEVSVRAGGRGRGNPEGIARRLRYQALAMLARENRCDFIATAHHAGDQLETVLMALLRGAGPAGLAGVAPARRIGGTRVVRPALNVGRDDLRSLCRESGWDWREDTTNADTTRLRSALRHRVIPILDSLKPGAARRASRSARLMADAARVVAGRAGDLLAGAEQEVGGGLTWRRTALRAERPVVLGALIRAAAIRLVGDRGRDRLGLKTIDPLIRAIRSRSTDPKRFNFRSLEAEVTARAVTIKPHA